MPENVVLIRERHEYELTLKDADGWHDSETTGRGKAGRATAKVATKTAASIVSMVRRGAILSGEECASTCLSERPCR